MPNKMIDLTGQKFGEWTVLEQSKIKHKHGIYWTCQCSCGLIKDICGTDLRQGKTTKCKKHKQNLESLIKEDTNYKSYIRINNHQGKIKNEIGNKYGLLTVVQQDSIDSVNRHVNWLCLCECGNYKTVPGYKLRNGMITHCGCQPKLMSNGELKIYNILKENNINFKKEFTFSDLKSPIKNTIPLRFDFAIFNDNHLVKLIEFQGIQHYQLSGRMHDPRENDKIKRQYCKEHNIKLLEIPYWDYDKIDINYLLNK